MVYHRTDLFRHLYLLRKDLRHLTKTESLVKMINDDVNNKLKNIDKYSNYIRYLGICIVITVLNESITIEWKILIRNIHL